MHTSVAECVNYRPKEVIRCPPPPLSALLLRQGLSLNLQLILFWLDRKSEIPSESGLCPLILGFQVTAEPLSLVSACNMGAGIQTLALMFMY